eukprot:jgi/Astpho2/427/Aster-03475
MQPKQEDGTEARPRGSADDGEASLSSRDRLAEGKPSVQPQALPGTSAQPVKLETVEECKGAAAQPEKKRRRGGHFTQSQLDALEDLYQSVSKPNMERRGALAQQLGLTDKQVSDWFVRRRQADKAPESADERPPVAAAGPAVGKLNTSQAGPAACQQPAATAATAAQPLVVGSSADEPTESPSTGEGEALMEQAACAQASPVVRGEAAATAAEGAKVRAELGGSNCGQGAARGAALEEVPTGSRGAVLEEAPTAVTLPSSAEAKAALLQQLEADIGQLVKDAAAISPLAALPAALTDAQKAKGLVKAEVAKWVAGKAESLTELAQQIQGIFGTATLSKTAVTSCIFEVAARKSFAAKYGSADALDASEDTSGAALWRWEVRDAKVLPKGLREEAVAMKKRMQRVRDRLTALHNACTALRSTATTKAAQNKVTKALEKLSKTAAQPLKDAQPAAVTAAAAPPAEDQAGPSQLAAQAAESQGCSEQPAGQVLEEPVAMEVDCLEGEANRSSTLAPAQLQKATTFSSEKQLKRGQSIMQSFLAKATPGKGSAAARGAAAAGSTPLAGSKRKASLEESGSKRLPYHDMFSPPPAGLRLRQPALFDKATEEEPPVNTLSAVAVEELFRASLQSWKRRALPHHLPGLPPSWSQREGAEERLRAVNLLGGRCWRRKLLHLPLRDRQICCSAVVKPRRFLAQDPEVDYEVMSDEEWEAEPEGEDLLRSEALFPQDDDLEEDDSDPEQSAASGFVVADGHLSDSEGFQDPEELNTELEGEVQSAAAARQVSPAEHVPACPNMLKLRAAMERARAANKPLVICRLPGSTDEGAHPGCMVLPGAVLQALEMQVLEPGLFVTVPPATAAEGCLEPQPEALTQAQGHRGRSSTQKNEDLLVPLLIKFLLARPDLTSWSKAQDSFVEAYPDRGLVKKWVRGKIKEIGEYRKGCWEIKAEALQAAGITDVESLRPGIARMFAAAEARTDAVPSVSDEQPLGIRALGAAGRPAPTDGLSGGASLKEAGAAPVASDEFARAGDPSPPSPLQAGTCTPSPQVVTAAPQEPELTSLPPPFSLMQPRAAQPPPPLVMPTAFRGLQDPFWALLLAHIVQGALNDETVDMLLEALQEENKGDWLEHLPQSVLSALIKAVSSRALSPSVRKKCGQLAKLVVQMLCDTTPGPGPQPSEVWAGERALPVRASLLEVCTDQQLLPQMLELQSRGASEAAVAAMDLTATILSTGLDPPTEQDRGHHVYLAGRHAKEAAADMRQDVARRILVALLQDETTRSMLLEDDGTRRSLLAALCRRAGLNQSPRYSIRQGLTGLAVLLEDAETRDALLPSPQLDVSQQPEQTGFLADICKALHTRLIDKRPAASLGNHVKQHCFNLKLIYKLVLLVGSSGEAARFALEHGPGEVPSAATVVSALQDLADNGDPDSMYEAAACLDALQARHADVTGDEGTDLA